jgi:hypothetical protein
VALLALLVLKVLAALGPKNWLARAKVEILREVCAAGSAAACQEVYFCTSKASKAILREVCAAGSAAACQEVYFCTSKASKAILREACAAGSAAAASREILQLTKPL